MYVDGLKGDVLEIHSDQAGKKEVINSFCEVHSYAALGWAMMSSLVQVVPSRDLVLEYCPHKQSHSREHLNFRPMFNNRWSMDDSDTKLSFLWRVYTIFFLNPYDLIFPLCDLDMRFN